MKKLIVVSVIFLIVGNSFSQEITLNKEQTIDIIEGYFHDFNIEILHEINNNQINYRTDLSSVMFKNENIYFFRSTDQYNELRSFAKFKIDEVKIEEVTLKNYTGKNFNNEKVNYDVNIFKLSCNNCITESNSMTSELLLTNSNKEVLLRLRRALLHYQSLITPQIKNEFKDPFITNITISENIPKVYISEIELEEENSNKRIDNNESVTFILNIKNDDNLSLENLSIKVLELNNIKGLSYNKEMLLPTLSVNQTSKFTFEVNSNNQLNTGEAYFKLTIYKEEKVVSSKNIKIATFNSGETDINISNIPDVDIDIPSTKESNPNTFALLIGNEDYKSSQTTLGKESNVKYASNDASIFRQYLIKTFGIPSENITILLNATSAEIKQAIEKFKQIPLVNKNAKILFYYAGHGLPDQKTKEQYLIPVDVNASNLKLGINVNDLITNLNENSPKSIIMLFDACFSGAGRDESLLTTRGVRIVPKEQILTKNTIVLSSSSNIEPSNSYDIMQHGMFTYFLLKKIKTSNGNVSLQALYDYLYSNVREKSLLINNQIQTPTIMKSSEIETSLDSIKL